MGILNCAGLGAFSDERIMAGEVIAFGLRCPAIIDKLKLDDICIRDLEFASERISAALKARRPTPAPPTSALCGEVKTPAVQETK